MITCPKCGKELGDDAKFCDSCGARVEETPVSETPVMETPVTETPAETPAGNRKFPKKAILFGGIGVAVLAVLILVISLVACNGGKAKNNYALYVKDSEFFLADLKKDDKPWQLSADLVDTDEIGNKELADAGYFLGRSTYLSKDGRYIFFPDKIEKDDEGFNLYCRKASDPDAEPVRIDSDVQSYYVNSSATLVTYCKGNEGNLYQYKLGKDSKEKIASEVRNFMVSDDGKKILYENNEHNIYLKYADKDAEKIVSDVSTVAYVSEDLSTLYYKKDGALYKQVEGEDRVKIASEIDSVIRIYDSGEVYYTTAETKDIALMDLVDDDRKEADASLAEPEYPDFPDSPEYPSWLDYETQEEYNAAVKAYEDAYEKWEDEVDRMEEEYDKAREAYREKLSRDSLRTQLKEREVKQTDYSLCFYNGTETVVITDAFEGERAFSNCADDTPVIIYQTVTKNTDGKVNLSEIGSISDVEEKFSDASNAAVEHYVAIKDKATPIVEEDDQVATLQISDDGSMIYYLYYSLGGENHGDLYRIELSGGEVGKAELYESDVYIYNCGFVGKNDFGYFKDYKNGKGELYINKNKVDFDVHGDNIRIDSENGRIFYLTDWNAEKEYGTLKVYDGKDSEKIADDVHGISAAPGGRVLYLTDYDLSYYKGTLNEWDDGKTRKLDEDVVCIVPITTGKDD